MRIWESLPSRARAALIASLMSTAVYAQETPDEIVRRDLIAQAERARRGGDHAGAVEHARRAAELRATPSIEYFLAREYEALGRPVETLAAAGACARGAAADPTLPNRAVLVGACGAVVERAQRRVARVVVHVVGAAPAGATLRIDGSALSPAVLDAGYPVAPGTVRIEAAAPGHEPWYRDLPVVAGTAYDIEVTYVPTPPAPPPPPPPPVEVVVAPPPPPPAPVVVVAPRPSRNAAPLVVGGATAVASFVAAGVFYAVAAGARDDRDGACPGTPPSCMPSARDDDARYRSFVYATDVAIGFGAAAALTGALVWWLARPSPAEVPRVRVAPVLGGARGLGLGVVISL